MKATITVTIPVNYDTKVSEIRTALEKIPDNAKLSVDHYRGDQRDPSYTNLKFTWTEQR